MALVVSLTAAIAAIARAESDFATFDVAADPAFQNAAPMLKKYAEKHRPRAQNDFCVLGVQSAPNERSAFIFWRETDQMIAWSGEDINEIPPSKVWNLQKDVVADDAPEARSSSYLLSKSRLDRLQRACAASGLKASFPK